MRHRTSEYLEWAKNRRGATYNLATSGVAQFPLQGLVDANGNNLYGYRPLVDAIARHSQCDPDCVIEASGTSMANHLAMAALLNHGDEVLIEWPAYGPLLDVARYLGAEVHRFARLAEHGFAVDVEAVRAAVTPRTRLIVLTNLHNPSSALTPESVLREVGELAQEAGAHVLVDEVYLDAVYDQTPRSAFHLGPQFVITNALTKVYGLSGLRCGWILATPELAWKMRRLDDLFGSMQAFPAEALSAAAFARLDEIRERGRRIIDRDRVVLNEFLAAHPGIAIRNDFGTTCFMHLGRDADVFLEGLLEQWDTIAVPGRFFEMPNYLRIGMGVDHAMFAEGLRRLGLALG